MGPVEIQIPLLHCPSDGPKVVARERDIGASFGLHYPDCYGRKVVRCRAKPVTTGTALATAVRLHLYENSQE